MELLNNMDSPALSEELQLRLFDTVLEATLAAEAVVGIKERYLELAGSIIRLVFSGDALMSAFMPALLHIEIPAPKSYTMSFHIWDSESTGIDLPAPPFNSSCYTDRGDIWGMNSRRIRCAFHWIECSVNMMDMERGIAIYWVKSTAMLPYWCYASPVRTLFHWWMSYNGCQLLHAAAVGDTDGVILITGKGGVGKSTTALSCLSQGMQYLADDYLLVSLDPEPRVHSLYATAKLDSDQLVQFEEFNSLVTNHEFLDNEKAVVQLWPDYQTQMPRSLPIKAIVTPRFYEQGETTFGPVSKIALRHAAAFTTLSQLPYSGSETYTFIEELSNRSPCLELMLGHKRECVSNAIHSLLLSSPEEITSLALSSNDSEIKSRPLISVIIPVYNGAKFLSEAVACVLAQNYPALEIIIVDDGSTDQIQEVIAQLSADVRFFHQDNEGPSSARNRGIKDASGDFIAFLDVDDLWPENNLECLMDNLLSNPELDVVHGYAQVMNYNKILKVYEYIGNPKESFSYYIGAGLYRYRAFERIGLFDTELKFAEDTDWFNRATEAKLCIERLQNVTLNVRRHGGNMTAGKSLLELNALRVFKKALDRKRSALKTQDLDVNFLYENDYYTYHYLNWSEWLGSYKNKENLNFLEIGSQEGRSAVWFLTAILTHQTSRLTCIDPMWDNNESTFKHNIELTGAADKVRLIKKNSEEALLYLKENSFDFIYIDGSHMAINVLADSIYSWQLLKKNGLLLFDDYLWEPKKPKHERCQYPIDLFLNHFKDKIELIHKGYQVLVKKL